MDGARRVTPRFARELSRLLVEGINDDGGSRAAGGADLVGNRVELGQRATGEEHPGPLAGKGAGHPACSQPAACGFSLKVYGKVTGAMPKAVQTRSVSVMCCAVGRAYSRHQSN